MTYISFKDKDTFLFLYEMNNPELFELDEADQIAYYVMQQLVKKGKEEWGMVKPGIYPAIKDIEFMVVQNKTVTNWMTKNPGKDILGAPVYYYTKFQLDRNLMNQLRMDNVISNKISDTTFYFFQELAGEQYIQNKPLRSFGLSGYNGNHVAIVFTKNHTLQDIKTEIIQTILHELNHDYDRTAFHEDDVLSFNTPGSNPVKAKGQELFGVKNVPLNKDFQKELIDIGKYVKFLTKKGLLSKGTKEGIVWITRVWELKSITKEFVKYCDYRSIDWKSTDDPLFLNALEDWLSTQMETRIGIMADLNATGTYEDEKLLEKFFRKVFDYVKANIIVIINMFNSGEKVKFR